MKFDGKRGGVSFLLRERGKGATPCMLYMCHFKRRGFHSRGAHFREKGTP
jgi:hypothetical protein